MRSYLGGYFIVRNDTLKLNYIPKNYYSASSCMLDIIPDTWAWKQNISNKERDHPKALYNFSNMQIDEIREYSCELIKTNKLLIPYTFSDIKVAREFLSKFFSHFDGVKIVGITTSNYYSDEFDLEVGKDGYGVSEILSLKKVLINPEVLLATIS